MAFALLWVVWVILPNRAVNDSRFDPARYKADTGDKLEEGRLKARNDTRAAGAQVLAVLAVALGGLATWRTVRLTREGQITDRYSAAIQQLGDKQADASARLGAIYALERIARDSARDHWPVIELLVERLRDATPIVKGATGKQPDADVRAIATVLRRRRAWRENSSNVLQLWRLDLRHIRLERADLRRVNLTGSLLSGAHLDGARLENAHLENTVFRNAYLKGANLSRSNVSQADFVGANLEGADFSQAEMMPRAKFYEANVRDTIGLPRWAIRQARQSEPTAG